jgi:uncharacterized protein
MIVVDYEKLQAFVDKTQPHPVAGFDHIKRVHDICMKIAKEKTNVDYDVLKVAAYLHDAAVPILGNKDHHENAARVIGNLLHDIGLPVEKHSKVFAAIRTHSRQERGLVPASIEAQILKDADGIDGIGAVGILRAVLRSFKGGTYDGNVNENGLKLVKSRILNIQGSGSTFFTEEGQKMAEDKIKFLHLFMSQLQDELLKTNEGWKKPE